MHYRRWRVHGDPLYVRPLATATCTVDGCEKPSRERGWCGAHYMRWYRYGSVEPRRKPRGEMKRCGSCKQEFLRSDFFRNKSTYDGLQGYCKVCWTKKQKVWDAANTERMQSFRSASTSRYNMRKANLSPELVQELWERCGGLCQVCRQPERQRDRRSNTLFRLSLDHDHRTGKARGFLCHSCNKALGNARDDPAVLRALADYLERPAM